MARPIDTLQSANALIASGLQKEQAEAIVEVFSSVGDELATKSDIKLLESKINILLTLNTAVFGAILIQFIFG